MPKKSKDKRLVIGLGTGRCGSWSLTKLLNRQQDVYMTHEMFPCPWEGYDLGVRGVVNTLIHRDAKWVGDVNFFYLNYVQWILGWESTAKFVCLKRDREATVESWMKHSGAVNHWTSLTSEWREHDELFTNASFYFPKYDLPKREAIEAFYDDYYEWATVEAANTESFKIFSTEDLNTQNGIDSILDFIEYSGSRDYEICHINRFNKRFVEFQKMPFELGRCEACGSLENVAAWYKIIPHCGECSYVCNECKEKEEVKNA